MEAFKTVDFEAALDNLEKLRVRGGVRPAQYRRLSKGIANIRSGQDQGFAYDMQSSTGTFTAKNAEGKDARGKIGGMGGFNPLQGRKTSRAMGYLQKFAVLPVPKAENGFSLQPFAARPLRHAFLEQTPAVPGKFSTGFNPRNSFLKEGVKPLPKEFTETPEMGYLRKPALQSWAGFSPGKSFSTTTPTSFNPAPFTASAFRRPPATGTPAVPQPVSQTAQASQQAQPSQEPTLVMPDNSMPRQERAPVNFNRFGAINTALGAFGLASTVTAREPRIRATPEYRAVIRPFSGDQEQLSATLASIDSQGSAAAADLRNTAGSNTTAYLTGRAMLQKNSNQARAAAIAEDGRLRRADRDRFDGQLEEQNRINHSATVSDQKEREDRDYRRYLSRVGTGQSMMQQSLAYSNARQADEKNKAVQLSQVKERMNSIRDAGKYQVLYGAIARGGLESLTPELRAAYDELMGLVPGGGKGMKVSYLKGGGKVDATAEKLLSGANAGLKKAILSYTAFLAGASRGQMKDFQAYVRQLNRVSRITTKGS